jgi:hypothetical protein
LGPKPDAGGEGAAAAAGGTQGQTTDQPGTGGGAEAELVVTLPEGVNVDAEMLEGFTGVAKEAGLNSESASKVATWYAGQQAAREKAELDAWAQKDKSWADELRADPEFGGGNWDASIRAIDTAMAKFGGPPLRAELERVGMVNNPILARAFRAIGLAMAEANGPEGGSPGGPGAQPQKGELLARHYDKSQ